MPRKPREISSTGVYHVMLRGINRNNIFGDDQDRGKFIKTLKIVFRPKDKDNKPMPAPGHLHAYCLMDNHVHLLIAETNENISLIMKRIGVAYASYYNKRYDRFGPLFQGRFRSEPVGDAGYFVTLLRYIHMNPVRAGFVESLDSYHWSSWHEYASDTGGEQMCCHKLPFSRMSWKQVCDLVRNNVQQAVPSINLAQRKMTDSEATKIIGELCSGNDLTHLPRERRRSVIVDAINKGVGMRQLSRITNIGYTSIHLIVSKSRINKSNVSKEPSL